MSGPEQPSAMPPEDAVAAQTLRLQAESQAQLAAAQALLERERLRLQQLLAAPPAVPPPLATGLAGGLDAIERTMRTTMAYLDGHHRGSAPAAPVSGAP